VDIDRAVKILANLIKNDRATRGMTQREYARLLGGSNSSISNLENGNYLDLPEHRTLNKLAQEILRIEYSELIKLLEDGGSIDSSPPSKTELISAISQLDSMEDLLDIHSALSRRMDVLRDCR
jgi:transcriptional regulator with XRE-family HTH domain